MVNLITEDMLSPRNQVTLGVSNFVGLMLPYYLKKNPGVIQTGSTTMSRIANINVFAWI